MADDVPLPDLGPPPLDPPPWGRALVREYALILEQWQALNSVDKPGLTPEARASLEVVRQAAYERAAVVRAQAVNELLTILRWTREDAPGQLEAVLRGLDVPALLDKLRPGVDKAADDRVDERLEPVREAYAELLERVKGLERAATRQAPNRDGGQPVTPPLRGPSKVAPSGVV